MEKRVDALLVIAAQRAYLIGTRSVAGASGLLERIDALVARARAEGALVVHLPHDGKPGAPDEPGTDGWQSALATGDDEVMRKEGDDAFEGTGLHAVLRTRKFRRVAIVGVQSEMSVQATARTAMASGYEVVLPHDGHSTYDVPEWPGVAPMIPAEHAARVAECSLGPALGLVERTADVLFR